MNRSEDFMRNGLVGLASAMVVVGAAMATAGCSSSGETAGTGGTESTGGSSSSGGTVGTGGTESTGGSSSSTGGGTSGGSVTSLSGTVALSALTAAEAAQLCSDAVAYYRSAIDRASLCKWQGLAFGVSSSAPTDAKLQENCAGQETTCLQADPQSASCSEIPSPCTATVAEYSACITDQAAAFTQGVSTLPGCATVTTADKPALWEFMTAELPASCTLLDATCAGLNPPPPG
ncbi:MAG: hypothetical protein JW940_16265 [Polyangiaceae bacterium]|nr:hypothetical protein [Polyangiaceae bacterium]